MTSKKILTLDQLVKFCEKSKTYCFNSNDTGYKLAVQIPSKLIYEEVDDNKNLYATVKVCHTLLNRNGSYISEENMKKAMPSLKEYTPLLAYIHQLDDGTYDFHAHDFDIVKDEQGEERVVYKESQIGTFTVDEPYLSYDESAGKTYVMARVAIPKEYTMAAEIIKRKGGTKVSCELEISSYAYNAKEKYLELIDFKFVGCTCLGSNKDGSAIGEGMLGSRLDIEDFSSKNNSVFNYEQINDKLIDTLEKLNKTISSFNKNNEPKGGGLDMEEKIKELLEKYGKTMEDIDFDYTEMDEEALENKFKELFEEETDSTSEETEDNNDELQPSEDGEPQKLNDSFSIEFNGVSKTFELALNDKIWALTDLVNTTYSEADNTWYSVTVYESYLVMVSWYDDVAYKQSYVQAEDSFSLEGERVQVYANWLTTEEESTLKEMRSNYPIIQEELDAYKKSEDDTKKEAIFADEAFTEYLDFEEFKELIKLKDKYSVEELQEKADIAYAKCIKKNKGFALSENKNNKSHRLFSTNPTQSKKPYGSLFN